MDIQTVANLFYVFLLLIGLISFTTGYLTMKKTRLSSAGFYAMTLLSFALMILHFMWYTRAVQVTYTPTIPWLFNMAAAVVLYIVFLVVGAAVLRSISRKRDYRSTTS
ncbi:hypothetical protein [Jeotgalibacillus terrae]|uniref:Uncharacterized protein n=1 Tax=Jeotgalibacillus terrae TaxID=587735 RepID=A0ABW5ZIU1_9BACL|nr:hypothetical protein [Jeotgalibacillus terrae]MBM7578645.1 apolipoprotein N-acyltransferase [Jeotgalibacillus terrae]